MRKNNKRGFTMAEMLIVVAIIGVLAGVAFIAVQSHQRSMAQLERDTIAKEIYFAAQNHLTMAEGQGYLTGTAVSVDSTFFGKEETAADSAKTGITVNANTGKIYYAVVNGGTSFTSTPILDLMLPFGSIDETVRAGGSYIIRYQANPAIVLDVFYCSKSGQPDKFNHTITESEYSTFLGYRDNVPNSGYVVGWYGGAGTGEAGSYLKTPSVDVTNAEKLTVKVTDLNKGDANASIKLIVEGVSSKAKAAFILNVANRDDRVSENTTGVPSDRSEYVVTLDDITKQNTSGKGWHFADLNDASLRSLCVDVTGKFEPGENIVVVAVSYSNSSLTNIAYSNEITTNSLYADLIEVDEETEKDENTGNETIITPKSATAVINNIRHLENLDKSLSGWNVDLTDAKQIADLDWSTFVTQIGKGTVSICKQGDTTKGTKTDCYLPVSNASELIYDGNNHKITNIVVDTTGDTSSDTMVSVNEGGVFGSLVSGEVKNLELVDTKVTLASGNAGALAGALSGTTVSNVLARNTPEFETEMAKTEATKTTVSTAATGSSAGGLIGSATNCTIQKSAAALIVNSTDGNAGGLIGTAVGGTVTDCYSGGHAIDASNGSGAVIYSNEQFNVTATVGYAGGLIGDAGAATINNSYSTCSVAGRYAGGFVGKGDTGGSATNSYATGLVLGGDTTTKSVTGDDGTSKKETTFTEIEAQEGAFAYAFGGTTTNCKFFEIVNEREEKDGTGAPTGGYMYLPPIPNNATKVIDALDENAVAYNNFCGASADWKPAEPYKQQTKLEIYYGGKYNLKTVEQLGTSVVPTDFVATHYGDWPAPEIFVVNTK